MSLKAEEAEQAKPVSTTTVLKPKKLVFTDELDEEPTKQPTKPPKVPHVAELVVSDADRLAGFLNYFITPSYLRKSLFDDLKPYASAKKLPKLPNTPFLSHTSSTDRYLMGLSVAGKKVEKKSHKSSKRKSKKKETTSFVNIGESVYLELGNGAKVPVNSRIIVDTKNKTVVTVAEAYGGLAAAAANENIETEEPAWTSIPLGYNVRVVKNFGDVFTESPFPDGYRYTAWVPCSEFLVSTSTAEATEQALKTVSLISEDSFLKKGITEEEDQVPLLLVFGKWKELAATILSDNENFGDLTEPTSLFDGRVRVSRATRVEDAVLVALAKIDGM